MCQKITGRLTGKQADLDRFLLHLQRTHEVTNLRIQRNTNCETHSRYHRYYFTLRSRTQCSRET